MSSRKIRHAKLNEVNAPERSEHSLLSAGLLVFGLAMTTSSPALGSGSFSKTGTMNVARDDHTATLLANGEVLVVGGIYGLAAQHTAEVYNSAKGKFTFTGNLNNGRWAHQAVLLPDGRCSWREVLIPTITSLPVPSSTTPPPALGRRPAA